VVTGLGTEGKDRQEGVTQGILVGDEQVLYLGWVVETQRHI
jgi:hypothetical protein